MQTPGAPQMKPLLDAILFLAWVTAYLSMVSWVSRYRRTRVHPLDSSGASEYRADRDMTLWVTVFVLGVGLLFLTYLVSQAISQFY